MKYNLTKGKWGEKVAENFLSRNGFKVLDHNYHTTQGEIDIVAKKGGDFYFVEVKTRQMGEMANDLAVTREKLKRFDKAVKKYCYTRDIDGGIITAIIIIAYDRLTSKAKIRFVPIY